MAGKNLPKKVVEIERRAEIMEGRLFMLYHQIPEELSQNPAFQDRDIGKAAIKAGYKPGNVFNYKIVIELKK